MEIWHIWIIAALVFVIIEIFTSTFAVVCLSVGCVGGAIAAACDADVKIQVAVFAVATFISIIGVRPLLKRLVSKKGGDYKSNADALIGRTAIVSEEINPDTLSGRVAIDGDDWKAVSLDNTPIAKGEKVEIVERESVILTVKKL